MKSLRAALPIVLAALWSASTQATTISYQFLDQDYSAQDILGLANDTVRIGGFIEVSDTAADDGFLDESEVRSYFIETYDRLGQLRWRGSIGQAGASITFDNVRIDDTTIYLDRPGAGGGQRGLFDLAFQRGPGFNDLEAISFSTRGAVPNDEQRFLLVGPRDHEILNLIRTDIGYRYNYDDEGLSGNGRSLGPLDPRWLIARNNAPPPPPPPPPMVAGAPAPVAALLAVGLFGVMATRRGR